MHTCTHQLGRNTIQAISSRFSEVYYKRFSVPEAWGSNDWASYFPIGPQVHAHTCTQNTHTKHTQNTHTQTHTDTYMPSLTNSRQGNTFPLSSPSPYHPPAPLPLCLSSVSSRSRALSLAANLSLQLFLSPTRVHKLRAFSVSVNVCVSACVRACCVGEPSRTRTFFSLWGFSLGLEQALKKQI